MQLGIIIKKSNTKSSKNYLFIFKKFISLAKFIENLYKIMRLRI